MNVRRSWLALLVVGLPVLGGCSMRIGADGDLEGEGKARGAKAAIRGTYSPLVAAPPPPYESHCSPAPSLVTSAICVCRELGITGSLQTIAGSTGTADVGVGGDVELASGTSIEGSLRASGRIESAGSLDIEQHLWAANGISFAGSLQVGGDLASGGDVEGAGSVDVGGALRVDGSLDHAGSERIGGRGGYVPPSTAPCGCDPASLYDVARAVAIARDANDISVANLARDGILSVGSSELFLPSGRYYVKNLASVGSLRIVVEGEVQLYVDGDLETVGSGNLSIGRGGSLDLFVAGTVETVGSLDAGDADRPSAFRLYVGGAAARISITGSASFNGLLYAPTAIVELTGGTDIHGAILAGSLIKTGSLRVEGERVTSYGERCEAPPASVTTPPSSAPAPIPATPTPANPSPPASDPAPCVDAGAPPSEPR
jgi:hypothetical protein